MTLEELVELRAKGYVPTTPEAVDLFRRLDRVLDELRRRFIEGEHTMVDSDTGEPVDPTLVVAWDLVHSKVVLDDGSVVRVVVE